MSVGSVDTFAVVVTTVLPLLALSVLLALVDTHLCTCNTERIV